MEIVKFPERPKPTDENTTIPTLPLVIERLEKMLEVARKGGIDSLCVVMTTYEGNVIDSMVCDINTANVFTIVGGLAALQHDLYEMRDPDTELES